MMDELFYNEDNLLLIEIENYDHHIAPDEETLVKTCLLVQRDGSFFTEFVYKTGRRIMRHVKLSKQEFATIVLLTDIAYESDDTTFDDGKNADKVKITITPEHRDKKRIPQGYVEGVGTLEPLVDYVKGLIRC